MKTKKLINVLLVALMLCLSIIISIIPVSADTPYVRVNAIDMPVGYTVVEFPKMGSYTSKISSVDYTLSYKAEGLQLRSFEAPNLPGHIYNNIESEGKIRLVASNAVSGFDFSTRKYLAIAKFKVKYSPNHITMSSTLNGVYDMNLNKLTPLIKHSWGVLGDLDKSNSVNTQDASILQQYLVELATLTDDQKILADANCDGRISIADVSHINRYLAGIISEM